MTHELQALIAALEALLKRRLELLRHMDVPTPSVAELERWWKL